MKNGWVTKKLGEVCEINYGTRVRRKDSRSDDYPVYGGGGETFRWETFNREDQCVVSRFAMSPECVRFVSGKFFLNDSGLTVDTAKDGLWQDYLDWCLFGKQDVIYALGKGSAQKNLDMREFVNIPIPIPPLAEQKRIVAKIDEAFEKIDALKANAERNLANAKELFQSALDEAVRPKPGWVEKRLGEVCLSIMDGDWIESKDQSSNGIRLVQTGNVGVGRFIPKDDRRHYISEATFNRLKCTEIFFGDILVSRLPDPVGRACIVPQSDQRMITAVDCSIVRLNQSIYDGWFFIYYASSIKWLYDIEAKCTGSTRKRISRKNLQEITVPVPPLPEQKRIAEKLDALSQMTETLQQNYARQIADCAEMRKAILLEAFEGRL